MTGQKDLGLVHSCMSDLCLFPIAGHVGEHAVVEVLHEAWCTKESGTAFFGKTNWRRRWFKLVQRGQDVWLEYYR